MSDEATLDEFTEASESVPNRGDEKEQSPSESQFWGITPRGWELVKGSEVYDVNPNPNPDEEPNSYIEMDALDTKLPWPRYFGERNASEYSGKTFTAGDTLFARITPCTENGKAALVPKMDTRVGIGSTEYAVLSPKPDRILPWYLYYVAKSHPVHDYAISRMRGSTGRQRVPFSVFRRELDIALPPIEEQRKIASVLYNIDQAIQNTEELIHRTKRVKKGLTQDLLSDGIHNEPQVETDSRFGKVPQSWELEPLREVGEIAGRTAPEKDETECWGGDIPWATPSEMTSLEGPTISDTDEHLTEVALEKVSSNLLPPESVLLTTRATVGVCAVNTVEMTTNQGFKSLIPGERLDTWYAYYRLESEGDYLASLSKGSTFPEVGKGTVENFVIPVPTLKEQKVIGERLKSVDDLALSYKSNKKQLQLIKQSLMQDLLSGDVRTHDKDIEVIDEVLQHG